MKWDAECLNNFLRFHLLNQNQQYNSYLWMFSLSYFSSTYLEILIYATTSKKLFVEKNGISEYEAGRKHFWGNSNLTSCPFQEFVYHTLHYWHSQTSTSNISVLKNSQPHKWTYSIRKLYYCQKFYLYA